MNKKNPYGFGNPHHAYDQGKGGRKPHDPGDLSTLTGDTGEVPDDEDLLNISYLNAANPLPQEAAKKVVIPMEGLTDAELKAMAEERLCPGCAIRQEAEDARLRALAELDNARKRLQREKEEHISYAAEGVLADIIPALDNLDLALAHARQNSACKDLVMGVDMTKKMLLDSLKKHGLEVVGEVGEPFDPNLHEAVGMDNIPQIADNALAQLLSKGYKLKSRLLRPARVMVNKKG